MEYIFAIGIVLLCCLGLGVGVFFFGKAGHREACGSVPELDHDNCPSQEAGLCPFEDDTGVMKVASRSKISYRSRKISD